MFVTDFQQDEQNNPAERPTYTRRLPVARGVKFEEMNCPPVIPKSDHGATFAKRIMQLLCGGNGGVERLGLSAFFAHGLSQHFLEQLLLGRSQARHHAGLALTLVA